MSKEMLYIILSIKIFIVKILKVSLHDLLLIVFILGVLGYFISTLVIIPVISPDPTINSFPDACSSKSNCTRLADTNNNRMDNMTPPMVNANTTEVMKGIESWAEAQTILYQTNTFIHIRWTMPLTRFRDDVLIQLNPKNNDTQTVIWIQSQSRLGSYDFNTNTNRVNSFLNYIESYHFT